MREAIKDQSLAVETPATGAPARARRRVPAFVLGLAGAVVTMIYGIAVMRLRFGPPLVMLGLGGLTLVLSGIALWRVLDPLSRVEVAVVAAPRTRSRPRELEREKQLVLKAIKEVELDYQMRKIAEPDYREMIERYRARALRLMSELEAGDNFKPLIERELRDRLALAENQPEVEAAARDAAPSNVAPANAAPSSGGRSRSDEATPGLCKSCGTRNDEDAQFCKKCGGKLGSS